MATITIGSSIEERVLVLNWSQGSVSLNDETPETKSEWEYLQSRGLYGKYGHWVDPDNCLLLDLLIALNILVGPNQVTLDDKALAQVENEEAQEAANPIPQGAVS